MRHLFVPILALIALALPPHALAQSKPATSGQAKASRPSTAWTEGVVRTIYAKDGQMTISHEPLLNLGMGKMTMTFRVKRSVSIEGVKEGSRIRFVAEMVEGELTVVALQPAT